MRKHNTNLKNLTTMMNMLMDMGQDIKHRMVFGTMVMKDGGRLAAHLNVWTEKSGVTVNICDAVTYIFDDEEEFKKFLVARDFKEYDSEKELQMAMGMDEAAWEAWNAGEEKDC